MRTAARDRARSVAQRSLIGRPRPRSDGAAPTPPPTPTPSTSSPSPAPSRLLPTTRSGAPSQRRTASIGAGSGGELWRRAKAAALEAAATEGARFRQTLSSVEGDSFTSRPLPAPRGAPSKPGGGGGGGGSSRTAETTRGSARSVASESSFKSVPAAELEADPLLEEPVEPRGPPNPARAARMIAWKKRALKAKQRREAEAAAAALGDAAPPTSEDAAKPAATSGGGAAGSAGDAGAEGGGAAGAAAGSGGVTQRAPKTSRQSATRIGSGATLGAQSTEALPRAPTIKFERRPEGEGELQPSLGPNPSQTLTEGGGRDAFRRRLPGRRAASPEPLTRARP